MSTFLGSITQGCASVVNQSSMEATPAMGWRKVMATPGGNGQPTYKGPGNKRSGRGQTAKSHPGQAAGSKRKSEKKYGVEKPATAKKSSG